MKRGVDRSFNLALGLLTEPGLAKLNSAVAIEHNKRGKRLNLKDRLHLRIAIEKFRPSHLVLFDERAPRLLVVIRTDPDHLHRLPREFLVESRHHRNRFAAGW